MWQWSFFDARRAHTHTFIFSSFCAPSLLRSGSRLFASLAAAVPHPLTSLPPPCNLLKAPIQEILLLHPTLPLPPRHCRHDRSPLPQAPLRRARRWYDLLLCSFSRTSSFGFPSSCASGIRSRSSFCTISLLCSCAQAGPPSVSSSMLLVSFAAGPVPAIWGSFPGQ